MPFDGAQFGRDVVAAVKAYVAREAAQLMIEHKIGGLPVVDNSGDVVGIITESDIFRAFVATPEPPPSA